MNKLENKMITDINRPKYTPMMEQYIEIKKDYLDTIVFFRIGDFYEMFFEDAIVASKVLEIALTGKDAGVEDRVPMCGVPFHAVNPYLEKLVANGYKVAIVEQVEDPTLAKGLVKRDVVRLVTPGTIIEEGSIKEGENNFVASIYDAKNEFYLAFSDISTGEMNVTSIEHDETALQTQILGLKVKEIVVSSKFPKKYISALLKNYDLVLSNEEETLLSPNFQYIIQKLPEEGYCISAGILVNYFIKTQRRNLSHLKEAQLYRNTNYLHIDFYSKRNLEITETLRMNQKYGSLLWLLDKCETAMGSRMMRHWLDYPLISKAKINQRLDMVSSLMSHFEIRTEIKEIFKTVYDLERIVGRISYGSANAKDMVQLRKSLEHIPNLRELLSKLNTSLATTLQNKIDEMPELLCLLSKSIVDEPPLSIKEGGFILPGYSIELDELKNASIHGKEWILELERKERERTGIKNLKVGYNRIFGYYIEISKVNLGLLPEDSGYIRKQTIANGERFITPELKEMENTILNAQEKSVQLEYQLFVNIRNEAEKYISRLQQLADYISEVDCLVSFAEISLNNRYIRPEFNDQNECTIVQGRHPVLEVIQDSVFVANDIFVTSSYNILLITGPNMSGKSTYMRMVAIICIMAQIGCYVPCDSCNLPIFDQIFTRIGASDDLVSGQSTFMVEMLEANNAIKHATKNSLILFDELGRGTATYDGMALAQGIIEYIHEKIDCTMLFSTHYHELINLEYTLKKLKNIHVTAKEDKGGLVFLHKVVDGPSDKSFGINVASLAHLPKSLIERSKMILDHLETNNQNKAMIGLDLFNFEDSNLDTEETIVMRKEDQEILDELESIDLEDLSPREAMNLLYEWKTKLHS